MAIDSRYIADMSLQNYLFDRDNAEFLAAGTVKFYRDSSRTEYKPVYTISGDYPNYTFVPIPNPNTLSPLGQITDDNNNPVPLYYFPFLDQNSTELDLYYVVVESAGEVEQFTLEAWPPGASDAFTPTEVIWSDNFIPNGQFLVHNNFPDDGEMPGGATPIAQGGWYFELPDSPASTNFVRFVPIENWTSNPPESPPFQCEVNCTIPDSGDSVKRLSVRFSDVNKFASDSQPYGFAFSARANTTSTMVSVQIIKNYGEGGSATEITTLQNFLITAQQSIFGVSIPSFGDNAGKVIGPNSYVAVAIAFDPNLTFDLLFTDFMLVLGDNIITNYPIQTNADTMTRTVFGWTDVPDPDGFDLYLPAILTQKGMTWDRSQIGMPILVDGPILSPFSTTPIPQNNIMAANGDAYRYDAYASNGIPLARYGNFLLETAVVPRVPRYGTGLDFATVYATSDLDVFRLTVNSSGTGVPYAADGNTGWTFTGGVVYDGSTTGSNSFNYIAYSFAPNTIYCVANFSGSPIEEPNAGDSGFTITVPNLLEFQFDSFAVETVDCAALTVGSGLSAKYFYFGDTTNVYYVYFNVTGEIDPGAPVVGAIPIECNLTAIPLGTAQDVADALREIMCAFQQTYITVTTTVLTSGAYFLFSTNPGSLQNYYAWLDIDDQGGDPQLPGREGIRIPVESDGTGAEWVEAIQLAINTVQYASPDWRGMFARGTDFTALWDKDAPNRLTHVTGAYGEQYGTFEYQQFLSHVHQAGVVNYAGGGNQFESGAGFTPLTATQASGGNETRPVNFWGTWAIRY